MRAVATCLLAIQTASALSLRARPGPAALSCGVKRLRGGISSMSSIAVVVDVEVKPDRINEFLGEAILCDCFADSAAVRVRVVPLLAARCLRMGVGSSSQEKNLFDTHRE